MITLYHGSYIQVGKPLVKLGRKKVDFGQGFYLTKLRQQASSWAKTIAVFTTDYYSIFYR